MAKLIDDEDQIEEVKEYLARRHEPTVVFLYANWHKKSSQLLQEHINNESAIKDTSASLICIQADADDEVENYALSLGMTTIPSIRILADGGKEMVTFNDMAECTVAASMEVLKQLQLTGVREGYAKTAADDRGGCCVSVDASLNGYSLEDIAKVGAANLGLGCGNPLSFAELKDGETVVDLGSGAGIDVFLAAALVGTSGKAIGVDMTPEMLAKARGLKVEKGIKNCEFRLGEIENLPIANDEADAIISNCVINLSPDKSRVFQECFRVLRPGGRVCISDVVMRENKILPDALRTEESLAC